MCSRRITSGLSVDQEVELQCLVHQLQLSDGASGTSSSVLVTPLSPNRTSLIKSFISQMRLMSMRHLLRLQT